MNPASAQNASDFGYTIEQRRQFGRWAAADGSDFVISDQRAGATAQEAVNFSHNPITGITQSVQVTGGSSVDIDGNYAAIVTRGTTGSVRLYKKTDGIWSDDIVATIAAPVGASTQLGSSQKAVAYDDSTGLLVVGDLSGNSNQRTE